MKKSMQNKLPVEFKAIYSPLFNLKRILQSKITILDAHNFTVVMHGLIFMHYTSFVLSALARYRDIDKRKVIQIRILIENILEHDVYLISNSDRALLISYVDYFAKLINLNLSYLIHVCLFDGYLDFEIYFHFHDEKRIFNFKDYCCFDEYSCKIMRENFISSKAVIKKLSSDWQHANSLIV